MLPAQQPRRIRHSGVLGPGDVKALPRRSACRITQSRQPGERGAFFGGAWCFFAGSGCIFRGSRVFFEEFYGFSRGLEAFSND